MKSEIYNMSFKIKSSEGIQFTMKGDDGTTYIYIHTYFTDAHAQVRLMANNY